MSLVIEETGLRISANEGWNLSLHIHTDSEDPQNVYKNTILGMLSAKIRKTPSGAIALNANLSHHKFLPRTICQPSLPFP